MALWRKWRKLLCHLCQCAKWHKYRKYRKNSIYGTFGTEMPHGTLAQVAQTSYMKGEFLYQLFIIMSINHQGGLTAVPVKIGKSAQGYVFY